jgi:acid phosphatase (class A)
LNYRRGLNMKALCSLAVALALMGGPVYSQQATMTATSETTALAKLHFLDPKTIPDMVNSLPAPPEPGSLAAQADLQGVLQVQAWRTPEQVAFAEKIDKGWGFDFADVLGPWFTASQLPAMKTLFLKVEDDAFVATGPAKNHFLRLRPPYVDPSVQPCIQVPSRKSYSYPSGHSTRLYLEALVLAEIFPDKREALLTWARKAGWSRVQAGVHFPSDVVGGQLYAEILFKALCRNAGFLASIERCKVEIKPWLLGKAG